MLAGLVAGAAVLVLAASGAAPGDMAARAGTEPVVGGHVVVPTAPTAVAVSPDSRRVYVVNEGDEPEHVHVITVIDAATLAVTASVKTCVGPVDIAAAGSNLLVACTGGQALHVMDATTMTVLRSVDLGADPRAIAMSPSGDVAYVLAYGARSPKQVPALIVVDVLHGAVLDRVRVGVISRALAISPDGRRAYVSNWGSESVTVINTRKRRVVETLDLGKTMPGALAVSPDGSRLLVNRENAGVPKPRILTVNTGSLDVVAAFRPGINVDAMAYNDTTMPVLGGYHSRGTLLLTAAEVDYEYAFAIIDLRTQRLLTSVSLDAPCRGADGFIDLAIAPDQRRAYIVGECLGQPGTLTAVDLPH
ncbi:MAG: YncE family protein [Actinomycetota bacterium]|nr:YncE family protein [Actinomycetota bacterium]